MSLNLLLANADDGRPVLEGDLPAGSVLAEPPPPPVPLPWRLYSLGGDPNALEEQRWGVIAPEGPRGDELLRWIQPLLEHRAAQQGAQVRQYRVKPDLDPVASEEWRKRVLRASSVPEREQPRYLMVLGDAHEVSIELQQQLAVDSCVGRLAFPDGGGYRTYVEKVLRWEASPSSEAMARTLFLAARDGSASTLIGGDALVAPSLRLCRAEQQLGQFPAREIAELSGGAADSTARLLAEAATPATVLFTLSHGTGAPRDGWTDAAEQRRRQGTPCFGPGQALTADALSRGPFLPGGVWFLFACFGAASPARSVYLPWLKRLKSGGHYAEPLARVLAALPKDGRPFFAAAPAAALANPDGPLAVIGHVDLAWTYAFLELSGLNHAHRFQGVLRELVRGRRAGVGLDVLSRSAAQVSVELTLLYQREQEVRARGLTGRPEPLDLAYRWMARNDLSGYVLLGDPAVRLPLAARARTPTARPGVRELVGDWAVSAPGSAGPSTARMEEAVLALLRGERTAEQLAAEHGVAVTEVLRWRSTYMTAGRAALAASKQG